MRYSAHTMPSADFCRPLVAPLDVAGSARSFFCLALQISRSPRLMRIPFTIMTVAFTSTLSGSAWGFNDIGHLTQRVRLMRFLFVGPALCLRLPSTCANHRAGGAGYPKPGNCADVGSFQTDSPALEGTISSFGRIEERRPAARPYPKYPGEKSAGRGPGHSAHHTTSRHSLEHPHHG